ncbi:DoxX family membrane protein [Chryseobacterium sp. Mn2064]|uniref:DoxX family membrane protein n=1 Tax=Chryseobacterium sp. Mn2064 TaxID=3395263 RepID=UPI003BE6393E
MDSKLGLAPFLLRLGLGITFLSAVAGRLGLWNDGSGWNDFLEYTASVNSFADKGMIPFLAITATGIEIGIGILLIIGFKIRWVALAASLLTLLFALSMAYSFGLKSPLDYSVFVDSTAAFLLAAISNHQWSLDEFLARNKS